jgi:hypothetical protein
MKNLAMYSPLVSGLKLHAQDLTNIVYSLALHPYYKLNYIEMAWGGMKEQAEEHMAGNLDAKDWQDEA